MSSSSNSNAGIEQRQKVEVMPLNPPNDLTYSFKKGNPIVSFQIAAQPKLLLGGSVRLNGTLIVNDNASALPNNNANKGGAAKEIRINERLGVHSCIQQITFSNQQNQTIESVRQYGRYLASVVPATHSAEDLNTNLQLKGLSSYKNNITGNLVNVPVEFSIPFLTGFLNSGTPIPLSQIGGINVQLELAPDSMVLSGADASSGTGSFYQLKDLSLTFDLLVPNAAGVAQMSSGGSGSLSYNSVNHLYSVINTGESTSSFNIGSANTLATIHNFIPSNEINNYAVDSFETKQLRNSPYNKADDQVPVEVDFIKSGVRFPLNYTIDNRTAQTEGTPSSQINRNFINAIKPFRQTNHTLNGNTTEIAKNDEVYEDTQLDIPLGRVVDEKENFGVGVALDNLSRVGVNYKNQTYAVRIRSGLNGASPNAMFSYILSKNTLMWSPQGIQVVS
jgi:hypothetical protein